MIGKRSGQNWTQLKLGHSEIQISTEGSELGHYPISCRQPSPDGGPATIKMRMALLVTVEDLVAGLTRDAERAADLRHWLAILGHRKSFKAIFLEAGAMNFIEKSAITTKAYWLRVYRICPNFAQ